MNKVLDRAGKRGTRRWLQSAQDVFALDLRSVAVFRIALALFVIYDLLYRSMDLTAHYTDAGTLPRAFVTSNYAWYQTLLCVHLLTGSTAGIAFLFLIHAAAAVGLLVGYRTRLMIILVWLLTASLHTRNPLLLSGGDDLLRVILFIAIFLPLEKRSGNESNIVASPATAIYYLQFIVVFFFTALLKWGPEWRTDGTAIYYALSIDQYVLRPGKILLNYPGLLKFLTFAVWWIELLGAFILLIPSKAARFAGLALFAGLQLGFGSTLALGHFPWVNLIVLIPFLPPSIWKTPVAQERKTRKRAPGPRRRWSEAVAVFFFAGMLFYNLKPFVRLPLIHDFFDPPILTLRLEQYWGMFAPAPNKEDGWYVIEGTLAGGSSIEAFREQRNVSYEKPKSAGEFYPNERWRRYMMNLWPRDFKDFRIPFARYLCINWNRGHSGPDRLQHIRMFYMLEKTPPPGNPTTVEKLNLLDYVCP